MRAAVLLTLALAACATSPSVVMTKRYRDRAPVAGQLDWFTPCIVWELDERAPEWTPLVRSNGPSGPVRVLLKGKPEQGTVGVIALSHVGDQVAGNLYASPNVLTPGTFFGVPRDALAARAGEKAGCRHRAAHADDAAGKTALLVEFYEPS